MTRGQNKQNVVEVLGMGLAFLCSVLILPRAHAQSCNPSQVGRLVAPDAAEFDVFGYAVSVSGDAAVVGVYGDDDFGSSSGSVYVYRRDGNGQWQQEAKLHADDAGANDFFGYSVCISGDEIIVGAPGDGPIALFSGSAYIFLRDGNGQWIQDGKLVPLNGALFDQFGTSVSISGDYILVGAPYHDTYDSDSGLVYAYQSINGSWEESLVWPQEVSGAEDYFGASVALSGGIFLVGAPGADGGSFDTGKVYAYRFGGPGYQEDGILQAGDAAEGDQFGTSVSVSGDLAIAGAVWNDEVALDAGAAYAFHWNGSAWTQQQKLLASDGAEDDRFGQAVSVSGDVAVVGAYFADAMALDSGAAYVFRWNGSIWNEDAKLIASDGADSDWFGWSLSASGDAAIVGAYQRSDVGNYSGAAYMYSLNCTGGPQLTASATCPGGGPIVISWSGATPRGQVGLIYARNTGSFHIPNGPCAGTVLGLGNNQIQLVWQGGAGNDGSRTLNSNAGNGACGGYLQLLDVTTCTPSNVVRLQ